MPELTPETPAQPAPELGLLLDVDGPIASPVSRTVAIPSILQDIVALTAAGVPIAFITGRSDAFIRDNVIAPLLENGLAEALALPGARMFAVFEKGAAWATVSPAGLGEVVVDESVALPQAFSDQIRDLIATEYADTIFFDETKRAMISVEQHVDVPTEDFLPEKHRFIEASFEALVRAGLGVRLGDREAPDAAGLVPFRIDPTIISVDIESVTLDKDRGAQRALEHFAESGPLPSLWRSVGDSRSDYLMADYLHSAGFDVAHVDVRPAEGLLEKPYRVIVEGDAVNDHAGAVFLRYWVEKLGA